MKCIHVCSVLKHAMVKLKKYKREMDIFKIEIFPEIYLTLFGNSVYNN